MRGVLQLGILLCQLRRGYAVWHLGHHSEPKWRRLGLPGRDYFSSMQQRRVPYQLCGALVRRRLQRSMWLRLTSIHVGRYPTAAVRRNRLPGRLHSVVLFLLSCRLCWVLVADCLLGRLWRRDVRQ